MSLLDFLVRNWRETTRRFWYHEPSLRNSFLYVFIRFYWVLVLSNLQSWFLIPFDSCILCSIHPASIQLWYYNSIHVFLVPWLEKDIYIRSPFSLSSYLLFLSASCNNLSLPLYSILTSYYLNLFYPFLSMA